MPPPTWWDTRPLHEVKFGVAFLVVGFIAVFLEQMNIILQVVLGAPIFEEAFKFGLAVVVVAGLRIHNVVARVAVALVVGGLFGTMEHHLSYWFETELDHLRRISFHGLSTSLSMVCYFILGKEQAVRVRWGATIPAVFVHYVNNSVALVFGIASMVGAYDGDLTVFALAINAALLVLHFVMFALRPAFVALARGTVNLLAKHV